MSEPLLHNNPLRLYQGMWAAGIALNCNVYWGCPTGCRYCYARLNRLSRGAKGNFDGTAGIRRLTSLVNKVFGPRYNPANAAEFFLHERFPVIVSNNSDPLSQLEVEHGYTRQYLELLADLDLPVYLLSKFGGWAGLDQEAYLALLKRFSRLWVGMTLTADNEACAAAWEPGAPTVETRLGIVKQLTKAGIPVAVQCVPNIPGMSFASGAWDDPATYRPFLERIKAAGAYAITMSPLNFDRNDVQVLGEAEKAWVVENGAWCKSEPDKPWRYFVPDVSVWEETSRVFYGEARRQGLRCGIHQAFVSLAAEPGELDSVVCPPEWVDRSMSWLYLSAQLRAAQEKHGKPIVTSTREVANVLAARCSWADHEFAWSSWRDSIPGKWMNAEYTARVAAMPKTVTVADVIHFQMQTLCGWSDCLWSDQATAPVGLAEEPGVQLVTDEGNYLLSYDRTSPRDSWAVCRSPEWDGRSAEALEDAVLLSGEAAWE